MKLDDLVEWNDHSEELTSEDVFADDFPFHCVEAESEDSEGNPVHVWIAYVGDGYVFDATTESCIAAGREIQRKICAHFGVDADTGRRRKGIREPLPDIADEIPGGYADLAAFAEDKPQCVAPMTAFLATAANEFAWHFDSEFLEDPPSRFIFDWFSGASARKTAAGGEIWIGAVSWHRAPDGTWTGPGAEELGARNLDGMFKDLLAASRSQKKRTK